MQFRFCKPLLANGKHVCFLLLILSKTDFRIQCGVQHIGAIFGHGDFLRVLDVICFVTVRFCMRCMCKIRRMPSDFEVHLNDRQGACARAPQLSSSSGYALVNERALSHP